MKDQWVSIKECTDMAEAVFLTSYLAENDIPAQNSAETMGAWTGRYSALSRGPQLRVPPQHVARARKLLKELNASLPAVSEEAFEEPSIDWQPGQDLQQCPLCGSPRIKKVARYFLLDAFFSFFIPGRNCFSAPAMWVCPDCDWDSRRHMSGENRCK